MKNETKEKVLALLLENNGKSVSGQEIADALGVTRAYVWKVVEELRRGGHDIKSMQNKGYSYVDTGVLSASRIEQLAKGGWHVVVKDELPSTNDELKRRAESGQPEGLVIVAKKQTAGRGRMGKSFFSPADTGVYFSLLLRPGCAVEKALFLTMRAAVAVAHAVHELSGKDARIKWVNDIFIDGRKICGILTEAAFDLDIKTINYVVIGIGINITTEEFPKEIENTAGSTGSIDRNMLIAGILSRIKTLGEAEVLSEYKRLSCVIGKRVKIVGRENEGDVLAVDINDSGNLVVQHEGGKKEVLSSGEISVRVAG